MLINQILMLCCLKSETTRTKNVVNITRGMFITIREAEFKDPSILKYKCLTEV